MRSRVLLALSFLTVLPLRAATPEYPRMGPDIYDPRADGQALISAALIRARAENKHVLLNLGANWCPWCRRLDTSFTTDPAVAQALQRNYVLVMIDLNTRHDPQRNAALVARYGNPLQHGLPVFVVLDAEGRQLATLSTAGLSDEQGEPRARLLELLARWAPAH